MTGAAPNTVDGASAGAGYAPWPVWSRDRPADLVRYVQYGSVARLLTRTAQVGGTSVAGLPGAGGASAWQRLASLCHLFRQRRIGYADEAAIPAAGGQLIRAPDEVLVAPKHGTCLDLAVTFAGACLDMDIHPMLVLLDPVRPGRPSHAIVVCWLGHDWRLTGRATPPLSTNDLPATQWDRAPVALLDRLRSGADQPGELVALDVALLAHRAVGPADTDHAVTLDRLVAAGAAMLTGADWTWRVGLDIGTAIEPLESHRFAEAYTDPVAAPYRTLDPILATPLEQVQARNNVVRFLGRDELDLLLDWCQAPDPSTSAGGTGGGAVRLAIVHGVGGSGKTHLAAELCHRLIPANWYAGFLTTQPADESDASRWRDGLAGWAVPCRRCWWSSTTPKPEPPMWRR